MLSNLKQIQTKHKKEIMKDNQEEYFIMINIKELKIQDLIPFEGSPFEFREDEGFAQLFDSISESGVFSPIVVCERDGKLPRLFPNYK